MSQGIVVNILKNRMSQLENNLTRKHAISVIASSIKSKSYGVDENSAFDRKCYKY